LQATVISEEAKICPASLETNRARRQWRLNSNMVRKAPRQGVTKMRNLPKVDPRADFHLGWISDPGSTVSEGFTAHKELARNLMKRKNPAKKGRCLARSGGNLTFLRYNPTTLRNFHQSFQY
jgi:hypothetical protein